MNAIFFGKTLEFVFEFIPQLIFMLSLFGYMIVMIFAKWLTNWTGIESRAPSIITLLMNIFLKLGSVVKNQFYLGRKTNLGRWEDAGKNQCYFTNPCFIMRPNYALSKAYYRI